MSISTYMSTSIRTEFSSNCVEPNMYPMFKQVYALASSRLSSKALNPNPVVETCQIHTVTNCSLRVNKLFRPYSGRYRPLIGCFRCSGLGRRNCLARGREVSGREHGLHLHAHTAIQSYLDTGPSSAYPGLSCLPMHMGLSTFAFNASKASCNSYV